MISKISKLLIVSTLLVGHVNTLYSMEDINQINNIENINNNINQMGIQNNIEIFCNDILKSLQDNETLPEEYYMQKLDYEEKLRNIQDEMLEINTILKNQLQEIHMMGVEYLMVQNHTLFNSICDMQKLSFKINDIAIKIKDINTRMEFTESNILQTIKKFCNTALGDNFSKLNSLFQNCSGKELEIVYKILVRKEVKEHILNFVPFIAEKLIPIEIDLQNKYKENNQKRAELIYKFKEQMNNAFKEDDIKSANIINELNTIRQNIINNNNNIIKNKIIDVIISYVNCHKNKMLQYKDKRIKSNLRFIK